MAQCLSHRTPLLLQAVLESECNHEATIPASVDQPALIRLPLIGRDLCKQNKSMHFRVKLNEIDSHVCRTYIETCLPLDLCIKEQLQS